MKTVCVIPARYASQRLPKKPLAVVRGRPLLAWVIQAARRLRGVQEILVATDHEEIARVAREAGVEAVMTDPECPSGTDRIQQALRGRDGDVVVNLQGDEPGMPAEAIDAALQALLRHPEAAAATACVPILSREDFEVPHIVKVVRDAQDFALYFSRSPVPSLPRRNPEETERPGYVWGHKHLGLYIYRREALEKFCTLPPSSLENIEKLEQLRMLENGLRMQCVLSPRDSVGVDVPEDLERAERFLTSQGS